MLTTKADILRQLVAIRFPPAHSYTIAQAVFGVRAALHRTQRELATDLDISPGTIRNLEAGTMAISTHTAAAFFRLCSRRGLSQFTALFSRYSRRRMA